MRLIHIAPTSMIAEIDERYNRGLNMVLTHLVLENEAYAHEMRKLEGIKYLDNSFFELGYCMEPEEMIEAAKMVEATHLICPDGTTYGMAEFKEAGYKVMCIPKSPEQFIKWMWDPDIDMVAVSEEHITERHDPGARYNFFRQYLNPLMPRDKIHLLGGTNSIWELGMLMPFEPFIYSWDSSAVVWQGHLQNRLKYMWEKNCEPVDFDIKIGWNDCMRDNMDFVTGITI